MNYARMVPVITAYLLCAAVEGKDYAPGEYPKKYEEMTASDWPEMKLLLEKVAGSTWAELADSQTAREASYVLDRIGDLEWVGGRRQEVVLCLATIVSTLGGEDPRFMRPEEVAAGELLSRRDARMRLPGAALRSLLATDFNKGCRRIEEIWKASLRHQATPYYRFLREPSLQSLMRYYSKDGVMACLRSIKALPNVVFIPRESAKMDELCLKHKLSKIEAQQEAWECLINLCECRDLKTVMTNASRAWWYTALTSMGEVHETLDARMPYRLAEEQEDLPKKYVLLYAACFVVNSGATGPEEYHSKELVQKIALAVERLYQTEEMSRAVAAKGACDFLTSAFSAMKSRVEKRSDASLEPPPNGG